MLSSQVDRFNQVFQQQWLQTSALIPEEVEIASFTRKHLDISVHINLIVSRARKKKKKNS